jgi:hypothetical protein
MWNQLSRLATEGLRDGDGAALVSNFNAGIDSLDESLVRFASLQLLPYTSARAVHRATRRPSASSPHLDPPLPAGVRWVVRAGLYTTQAPRTRSA